MTQDIDVCILSGFSNEKIYVDDLLKFFKPRISDAAAFAIANRVLLLSASNGVDIDLTLSGLLFEQIMIERASSFFYSQDCELITCSAEDLIILKAFANRMKDWSDVEGILIRHGKRLDTGYIIEQLTPLCEVKESPEIIEKLRNIIATEW
jgi:hypothetical protein